MKKGLMIFGRNFETSVIVISYIQDKKILQIVEALSEVVSIVFKSFNHVFYKKYYSLMILRKSIFITIFS